MKKCFLIWLLIGLTVSVKIFLFGSVLLYDDNPAYQRLAQQTGKPTLPNCDQNWFTTKCPKVAVITSACPDSACGEQQYYVGDGDNQAPTGQFFQKLGMSPKHVSTHIDNYAQSTNIFTEQGQDNVYIIKHADIIYFNGGDQSRHMRCWFNDDGLPNPIFSILRSRVLNDEVILVGVSAGTAVQSRVTYGGGSSFGILYFSNFVGLDPHNIGDPSGFNDLRNGTKGLQYEQNGAKMQGFGFIKQFQIDTHFDRRGRLGRMIPVMKQLNNTLGVGIDELACIYYKNGVGTIYGRNGVLIADVSEAYKVSGGYFQIRNVKLHYLTAGDTFNFITKKLTSEKSLISKPTYSGYIDSNNILSAYQCSKLLTRLIDQVALMNLGKTKTPEDQDYPAGTPQFEFTFYKEQQTKGYKNGNVYSVESAYLDISASERS